MRSVMLVFGTRPEAIKMCPLCIELKKRKSLQTYVCVTGQHRGLLDSVLDIFGVVPDFDLNIMRSGQSLDDLSRAIIGGVGGVLDAVRPDMLIVHGDTTTAAMSALAGFYRGIPIGHVEAGLRTDSIFSPFPEEFNRRMISLVATLNFAPTPFAVGNLRREGVGEAKIFMTGNTVTDALRITRGRGAVPEFLRDEKRRVILLTVHRRESRGDVMKGIFGAARRIADERNDVVIVCPLHPAHEVRLAAGCLYGSPAICPVEPLDMLTCHALMASSYLILTDSGGIQEEAVSLGIPALVLRDTTERPEGVAAGGLRLIGRDPETIYAEVCRLLDDEISYCSMKNAGNPYGNGHASEKISDAVENYFAINGRCSV